MITLYYQGHGSYRLASEDGRVIYIDPYAYPGCGYELLADLVLVTHQHGDHNHIKLVKQKPCCRIITNYEALVDGEYRKFCHNGIEVESVPAENQRHKVNESFGKCGRHSRRMLGREPDFMTEKIGIIMEK